MDETYIKVKGVWKYLYRAVDKQGKTVDFLLTAKRDMAAAKRFFDTAMGANGDPDKVAMDKSGANNAAIDAINAGRGVPILVRQVKYLNNIVEQDHRAIKRVTRPMLNFKSFRSAGSVLAGIELMHMIRKGQFAVDDASPCHSPTSSMRWHDKSVQCKPGHAQHEKIRAVLGSTTRQSLADLLCAGERSFTKPLRYDADNEVVFPDFILTDTPRDTPMEVFGRSDEAYSAPKEAKVAYYANKFGQGNWWCWDAASDPLGEKMPPIPPKR